MRPSKGRYDPAGGRCNPAGRKLNGEAKRRSSDQQKVRPPQPEVGRAGHLNSEPKAINRRGRKKPRQRVNEAYLPTLPSECRACLPRRDERTCPWCHYALRSRIFHLTFPFHSGVRRCDYLQAYVRISWSSELHSGGTIPSADDRR